MKQAKPLFDANNLTFKSGCSITVVFVVLFGVIPNWLAVKYGWDQYEPPKEKELTPTEIAIRENYDPVTGKPNDMSLEEWRSVKYRINTELHPISKEEGDKAARAIWNEYKRRSQ